MKSFKFLLPAFSIFFIYILLIPVSGCGVYSFNDVSPLPDSIKTVRVVTITNQAAYVNPQLSLLLTDKLRQKIVSQTRLTQTNNENAHYHIEGKITEYSVITTGVTSTNGQQQTSINRLTVSLTITLTNQLANKSPEDFSISRSFDFDARRSLQDAEKELLDQMVRNLTDEIFNRIFSNW